MSVRVSCQTIAFPYGRPVLAVPDHRGLALVGDAERGEIAACRPSRRQHLASTSWVRFQISTGSCSTQPARGRICSMLQLPFADLAAGVVEDHAASAGRALVDGGNEVGHVLSQPPPRQRLLAGSTL